MIFFILVTLHIIVCLVSFILKGIDVLVTTFTVSCYYFYQDIISNIKCIYNKDT